MTGAAKTAEHADPERGRRLTIGIPAVVLMTLSVFFSGLVLGFTDGTHSSLLGRGPGIREAIIGIVGLGALWFLLNPYRPDPRVAQAAMLAAGIVGVAVGFTQFAGALQLQPSGRIATSWPGPQTWMLLVSGALFVFLRFMRSLWPDSPWMTAVLARSMGGAGSRRR